MSWAFLPLSSSKVYERQSPGELVRTPRVSGLVAAARNNAHSLSVFPTPLDNTLSRSRAPSEEVDEGRAQVERGMWDVKQRVINPERHAFPDPARRQYSTHHEQ